MKELKYSLWHAGVAAMMVGGIGCAGYRYIGRDLYHNSGENSPINERPAVNVNPMFGLLTRESAYHLRLNDPVQAESSIASKEDYELLKHYVWESLPTLLPATGRITSKFGFRHAPLGRTKSKMNALGRDKVCKIKSLLHKGIDIAAEKGSDIVAAGSGRVRAAHFDVAYGNYVDIDHGNGIISRYAHAKALFVHKGELVSVGAKIATVGSSGRATGPHLHFEVREQGKPVDPEHYLIGNADSPSLVANTAQPKAHFIGFFRPI